MDITIVDFAIIIGGIMGYFISISLITSPFYKSRANNYLSISLFLITTLTLLDWYDIENILFQFINNILLDILFAVTMFTYFLIQIQHKHLNSKWYKWLYVPFIFSISTEILISISDIIFNHYNSFFDELIYYIKSIISYSYNVILIFWARHLIDKSNSISEEKKRWLLRLNFFIMCIVITWILSHLEAYLFDTDYITNYLWVLISFLSWWILYYGVFKLQIVVQKDQIHQYLVASKTNDTQIKKKINKTTVSKIITQLYMLMEEEELFKNPLLSRLDIATRLGTSEGYLSQIINQEINKSIIQFVNEYRIETAKNLLSNPVFYKYSIEAIGLESGFKSKSTFYSAFKASMSMSPGAFRKLQKKS